uniref:Serine/threonine-protein phosphatase n=1 Tax=Rhizophora mucronata TaxID=61149 RepID=A0A2P2MMI4_RHIMU
MKVVRLHKFMDFMMSAYGSMAMPMFGRSSQICLTIFRLQHWLNQKYSVSMVDCLPPLKPLITFEILIVFKKFPMRVLCVIFCGLTPTIVVVGESHQEVLDIPLAKTYQSNLIIQIT